MPLSKGLRLRAALAMSLVEGRENAPDLSRTKDRARPASLANEGCCRCAGRLAADPVRRGRRAQADSPDSQLARFGCPLSCDCHAHRFLRVSMGAV